MKRRLSMIYTVIFIFALLLPLQVLADGREDIGSPWLTGENEGDHDHAPIGSPWLTGEGEDDHDHAPIGSPWLTGEGEDSHGDHSSEFEEPGANLPLLGTFAAINGGFILLGAVLKYRKNKV